MIRTHFGKYRYLGVLAILSVTFALISNFTASRLISFGGATLSVSIYCFPMFFLISDILTEVYGYAQARTVVWLSIFSRLISGVVIALLLLIPAAPDFTNDAAYQLVLSSGLRASLAGLVAGFAGDMFNNYIVAKMKIWSSGRNLWARFVGGTFVGESVNSVAFYGLAFYGIIPNHKLILSMIMASIAKTLWEILALPLTYPLVRWLKKIEAVDYYDTHTNFNPLIIDQCDQKH